MPPPNWQTAGEIAGELFDDAVFGARTRGNLGSVPRSIAASERDRLWRQRDQYISSFVRRAQSLGNVSPNILRDQTQRTLLQLPQPPPRISRPITRTPQETFAAKPVQRELNRYTPPATISRAESEGRQGVPGRARTTSQTRQTPEAAGVGYDMKFFGVPTYGDITKVPASVRSKPGFQANWDARGAAIARSANIITSGERKSAQVEQDVLARQYPGLAPDKRYDPTLQYGQDVNEAIKTGDFGPSADAFRVLTRGPVSASLGVDTAKAFATWLAKEQPGIRTDSDPELLARPFGIFLSQPASAIYATSTGDTRMPQERPEALNTALTVGDVLLPILAMNGEASATKLSSLSGAERTAELGRIASRVLSADVLGNYSAMKDAGGPLNMAGGMIGSISSAFAPDTPFSQRIGGAAMLGIGALGGSHMLNGAADRLSSLLSDSSRAPREMVKPPVVDTYQYDPKADLASAFNEPRAENPKPNAARKPKADPSPSPKRTKSSNKTQVQNEQKTVDPSNARQIKTSHIDYANGENLYETVAKDTSGKPIGVVSWSDGGKDGGILIKHVEVREDMRRQGIASAMYDAIKKDNPDAKIKTFGSRTKEGSAFRKSYDKRNAPELPAPKRAKADAKPKTKPDPNAEPTVSRETKVVKPDVKPEIPKAEQPEAENSAGTKTPASNDSVFLKAWDRIDYETMVDVVADRIGKQSGMSHLDGIPRAIAAEVINLRQVLNDAGKDIPPLDSIIDEVVQRRGGADRLKSIADVFPDEKDRGVGSIAYRYATGDPAFSSLKPEDLPLYQANVDAEVKAKADAGAKAKIEEESSRLRAKYWNRVTVEGVTKSETDAIADDVASGRLTQSDFARFTRMTKSEHEAMADAVKVLAPKSIKTSLKYVSSRDLAKLVADLGVDNWQDAAKRYNDLPAVLVGVEPRAKPSHDKIRVANGEVNGEIWWTDTHQAYKGDPPKGVVVNMDSPMQIHRVIPDKLDTIPGRIIGVDKKGFTVIQSEDGGSVVNSGYIAMAKKLYGENVEFRLDSEKPNVKPILVLKDGESVGVIMPIAMPDEVKAFLKDHANGVGARTAKDAIADAKSAVQDFKDAPGPKGIKQGKRSGAEIQNNSGNGATRISELNAQIAASKAHSAELRSMAKGNKKYAADYKKGGGKGMSGVEPFTVLEAKARLNDIATRKLIAERDKLRVQYAPTGMDAEIIRQKKAQLTPLPRSLKFNHSDRKTIVEGKIAFPVTNVDPRTLRALGGDGLALIPGETQELHLVDKSGGSVRLIAKSAQADVDGFNAIRESLAQKKISAPRTAKDALADAKAAVQDFKDAPGPKGIKQGKRSGAAMVPLSPQKVEALGRAVKHYIEAGVLTVKEMHERIKADLGDYWDDGLRPHIAKIFKEHMSSGSQAEKPGPESPRAEKSTVKRASTPDVTTQVAQEPLDRLRNDLGMNAVDKKGTRLVDVVNSKIAKDIEAGGAAFAREYNAKPSRGSLTAEETAGIGRAIVSTLDRLKVAEKAVSDHISSGNVDQAAREDVGASLLRSDLAELTLAGHRGGSEWGLSGITRRLELKKDYSTDGILHKLVSAVKRKPTEEEVGKAGALSDKINLSAADIDEAIKAEVDRRVQEYIAAQTAPRSPRGAKNKLFTQSSYDAVIARRKGSRMSSKRSGSTNLSALDIADTATILGYHIEAGVRSFADLAARVKDVIPNATDADIAGIADRVLKEMHESNKRPPPKSKGATIARLKLEVKQITDPTAIEKATKLIEQLKQEPINATPEFWHDRYKQIVGQMREMSVGSRIAEDFLRSGADGIQSPQIRDLRVSLNRLKADADHWIQAHEKEGRTKLQHAVGLLGDVISLPKAFKASIDMSAIGRQGLMLFMANPARARGAFAAQFKAFSKLGAERVLADMQAHRSYDLARQSKLAIMDFTSSHLFPAEEEFLSSIAGNIPGIAQSERMYASYLSQLRLDWFDHMVSNIESSGDRVSIKEAKDIAHMINVATGRGTLGKFETSANLIGKLLFSVRFPVSRIQFLLGQPLWKGVLDPKTRISPRVAKEIGKLYAQTAIGYATTAVVLGLIGAKVGQDPDKSDYLKLRYGPLGIDLSAGLTKYFVLSNRIATDRMSSYRAQALARGMLAPVSGVAADFAFNHGRNPYKQETIPGKRPGTTKEQDRAYDWWDALELFTPIGADQAVQNQQSGLSSDEQIIGAAADFLGFGSNQYKHD